MRVETIGDATLYLGDCYDILPSIGAVDCVITDPPYGINEAAGKNKSRTKAAQARDYGNDDWDAQPPTQEQIGRVIAAAPWVALFGGNYFHVPPSSCWLVWDKLNSGDFADCELCWTNWPKAVRRMQWRWNGMIRQGNEERFHPTQKPLAVMGWVIDLCPKSDVILDPFMGSGTTGVAALQRGKKFIGIERDPTYFSVALSRMETAMRQPRLFDVEPTMQEQEPLL
ncbi:hypothetical protein BH09PSE6_BH09PSE6_17870 [soil metagenome]